MKKIIFAVALVVGIASTASAQLYTSLGQFHTVQLYYNPAFAGLTPSFKGNLLNRSQWSNLPGAPSTLLMTLDNPLARNLGGGAVIYRHKVGNFEDLTVNLNFSYRIKTGENSLIQFGLKAGVSSIDNGIAGAFYWDQDDSYLLSAAKRGVVIRMGPGGFYKRKNFYLGLSSPDLFFLDPSKIYFDNIENKSSLKRNIILMSGTRVNLSEFIVFQPDVMAKYYGGRPLNLYANLGLEFNQTFTAGASLSYPFGYGVFTRVAVSPKIKLGFRYELGNKSFKVGSYGSSEIMLSYGFNN
jgi:type IX secretion system PorP/SprF family membrane protein